MSSLPSIETNPPSHEADADTRREVLEQAASVLQSLLNVRNIPSSDMQHEHAAMVAKLRKLKGSDATVMRKLIEKVGDERKEIDPAGQGRIGDAPYQEKAPAGFAARLKNPLLPTPSTAALDAFLDEAKRTDANLLRLDRSLTTQQLEERIRILDRLCFLYKHANSEDAPLMKEALIRQFGIPTMPGAVQTELSQLESMSNISEGAENKNIFYRKDGTSPAVLKLTKSRHDDDFYSVLKLMRNMHVVALRLNRHEPGESFRAELPFEDMTVYLDDRGKFKRIIRQPYASGTPVQKLPDVVTSSPGFQRSWREYLAHLDSMKKSDGVVLDVTNSAAGMHPVRGSILDTENVFMREEGGRYVFTVIDPDVFDTREGEHKFDALAHIRDAQGGIFSRIKAVITAGKIWGTNFARVMVKNWQNTSMRGKGRKLGITDGI